jgi:UDP-GlcNAc:undecaprenyl-phosphate GlcNAc-1-phosphate transferase
VPETPLLSSPLLALPLIAFLLCVILHAAAQTLFPRWGLLDFPERYGLTRARLPYPTGAIAVLLFLVILPVVQPLNLQTVALLLGTLLLGVTCFVDDRRRLSPLLRFGLQIATACLLVACGIRIGAVTNPLVEILGMPGDTSLVLDSGWLLALSVLFTIVWLLLTINALNWFDGIPGQVSCITSIGFLTIGFLALSTRVNQPTLALIAFILAGLSVGCLLFDFPPPKVLMGDTGAMFFGLLLGVLTIYSGGKVATAFLVLGVPLIDLVFVIGRRIRRKQPLMKGNALDQHLHHRLLQRGWSPRQVIAFTAVIGTGFGVSALFLSTLGKIVASLLLFGIMIGMSVYSRPWRSAARA